MPENEDSKKVSLSSTTGAKREKFLGASGKQEEEKEDDEIQVITTFFQQAFATTIVLLTGVSIYKKLKIHDSCNPAKCISVRRLWRKKQ